MRNQLINIFVFFVNTIYCQSNAELMFHQKTCGDLEYSSYSFDHAYKMTYALGDDRLYIWDSKSSQLLKVTELNNPINHASWSPNNYNILIDYYPNSYYYSLDIVDVYNILTGENILHLEDSDRDITDAQWTDSNEKIMLTMEDNSVCIVDIKVGIESAKYIKVEKSISKAYYVKDNIVIINCDDGSIDYLNLASNEYKNIMTLREAVRIIDDLGNEEDVYYPSNVEITISQNRNYVFITRSQDAILMYSLSKKGYYLIRDRYRYNSSDWSDNSSKKSKSIGSVIDKINVLKSKNTNNLSQVKLSEDQDTIFKLPKDLKFHINSVNTTEDFLLYKEYKQDGFSSITLAPDANSIDLCLAQDYPIKLNLNTGEILELNNFECDTKIEQGTQSFDGKLKMTIEENLDIIITSAISNEIVYQIYGQWWRSKTPIVKFSPLDNKLFIFRSGDMEIVDLDSLKTDMYLEESFNLENKSPILFKDNGTKIVVFGRNKIFEFDLVENKMIRKLYVGNYIEGTIDYSRNNAILIRDSEIIFKDYTTGVDKLRISRLAKDEYLFKSSLGYYFSNPNVEKSLYLVDNLKVKPIDQQYINSFYVKDIWKKSFNPEVGE